MKYLSLLLLSSIMVGCGSSPPTSETTQSSAGSSQPNTSQDLSVVRGQATVNVGMSQDTAMMKLIDALMPSAYASTASTSIAYSNAASVMFSIDASSFAASGFTGNTLSLGHVDISALSDNNLNVCGANGNAKCTQAIIRVYTTSPSGVSGFVNTSDPNPYGMPVYAGSLNPSSPVGLNSAGSVQVQLYTIPNSQHKLSLSSFPSPQYSVTSDFSNAGAGTYSMTFVVEYALAP